MVLVLSQHYPRLLQSLHHCLETLHKHACWGCHQQDWVGPDGIRLRPGRGPAQTLSAQRQRFLLHFWRSGQMTGGSEDGPCPWRAIPPANSGQNRALASNHEKQGSAENYLLPDDLERQIGPSSNITTTSDTTRAWTTSHPPTSTSAPTKLYLGERKKSRNRQSNNAACNIKNKQHNQSHNRTRAFNVQAALMSHFIWRRILEVQPEATEWPFQITSTHLL